MIGSDSLKHRVGRVLFAILPLLVLVAGMIAPSVAHAARVTTGAYPRAVAINAVTNKVYVANYGSGNVTVIDGATNSVTTVTVGTNPHAVAVNPVTNKVYVANYGSANVTVIDGATNSTTTVSAGSNPYAVAVNPVTNKVYVANYVHGGGTVTVIDGATNTAATVTAGSMTCAVAVNPVTDKVYVANYNSANVTVIDGATNSVTTVDAGYGPSAVAVNSVTNKVYVANAGDTNNVTIIDGATGTATTVGAGLSPGAVDVNSVTNKAYVANYYSANVTVIDGADNSVTTVDAGGFPTAVAVNSVTNKVYVANSGSNNVTVIDGVTGSTTTVGAGGYPIAVAINPVTNKVYVANHYSDDVTVIDSPTLAYTAGPGGSIEGSATQVVTYGSDGTTVTAKPDAHHHFTGWSDGVPAAERKDPQVTASITATATFAIDTHTITVAPSTNGTITPGGPQTVEHGSDRTFTFTPDTGYHVFDVLKDGESIGASSSVTFANVTADHTISATFAINTYTLNYLAGNGGAITGAAAQTVEYDSSGTPVTAVADVGYRFVSWSDGVLTATHTYTNVTADKNVTAQFEIVPIPTTITLLSSAAYPAYGAPVTLTAHLTSSSGPALSGRNVVFQRWDGSKWVDIGSAVLADSAGKAKTSIIPHERAKTTYRVRFAGESPYAESTSRGVVVTPKVKLTRSSSWKTKYVGKSYAYKGYIYPRHSGSDSNRVKLQMYRKGSDGKYRLKKTVSASYSYYSSTKTTWTAKKVTFPSKGSWRVRAYHATDSRNYKGYSSWDYVTVK